MREGMNVHVSKVEDKREDGLPFGYLNFWIMKFPNFRALSSCNHLLASFPVDSCVACLVLLEVLVV